MVAAQYSEEVLANLPKHLRLVLEFAAAENLLCDDKDETTTLN